MARYVLPLATALLSYTGMASALGLGEMTLASALNQPLDARIELHDTSGLSVEDIKVSLATNAAFQSTGIERFAHLSDLRFLPEMRDGQLSVRVTSSAPIREPYLDFIVDLARPNGVLRREYTLLLDPLPSQPIVPAVAALPAVEAMTTVATKVPEPMATPAALAGQRYRVRAGDSLWLIASRLAEGDQSAHTLMRDIMVLNPEAFAGGDASRLQLGAELLLPDAIDASRLANPAAVDAQETVTAEAPTRLPAIDTPATDMEAIADATTASPAAPEPTVDPLVDEIAALEARVTDMQLALERRSGELAELEAQLSSRAVETAPAAQPTVAKVAPPTDSGVIAASDQSSHLWLIGAALAFITAGAALWASYRPRRQRDPIDDLIVPSAHPHEAAVRDSRMAPLTPSRIANSRSRARRQSAPLALNALEAASMLISAARYAEAKRILESALVAEPERMTLRLLLLEMLGQLGDTEAFALELVRLIDQGASIRQLDEIRSRHASRIGGLAAEQDLERAVRMSKSAADAAFTSNLHELPEVVEMHADHSALAAFGPNADAKGRTSAA